MKEKHLRDNLTNKSDAQLLGIIEGNLISVLTFADMKDYHKEWIKTSLRAAQLIKH